jgi:putative nucleotidyltransferase with HDIG domain
MPTAKSLSPRFLRLTFIIIPTGFIALCLFLLVLFYNQSTDNYASELIAVFFCIFLLLDLSIFKLLPQEKTIPGSIFFLLAWIPIFVLFSQWIIQFNEDYLYALPLGISILVIRYFYSDLLALVIYLFTALSIFLLVQASVEWMVLQIFIGFIILFIPFNIKKPLGILGSITFIYIASIFFSLSLTRLESTLNTNNKFLFIFLLIQSCLLIISWFLISFFERKFSFFSSYSLLELGSLDHILLKELASKAPGTYQHSIQVGYLAELAARKIKVDSLLCRVGGLYHDIGKMMNPGYFNENMSQSNPYENHSLPRSAEFIIKHVADGVVLGKKYGLPEVILDFIRTHHGTTKVEYFYRKFLLSQDFDHAETSDFTYPGPKPETREQSIVMLADTVEAGCRSLKNPTEKEMVHLIDRLVENKIRGGQFQESRLSFEELELCKEVFKEYIKTFYHQRISYPEPVGSGQEYL